ncbi:unnamed protein product [Cuscuta campestris]|uniref:Uncharacterized protein n=1 Tax=Cuscuta campestris TaxID=132261 RepID=A0A484KXA1_9ASTE|nr:unnamed protein product [Cuscuta campestris]
MEKMYGCRAQTVNRYDDFNWVSASFFFDRSQSADHRHRLLLHSETRKGDASPRWADLSDDSLSLFRPRRSDPIDSDNRRGFLRRVINGDRDAVAERRRLARKAAARGVARAPSLTSDPVPAIFDDDSSAPAS